jgi:hypothetical protein
MIKMRIAKNDIPKLNKKIQAQLDKLPKEVYEEFVDNTPVRSGNARKNTKLKKNTIVADYPYAKRLNEGWSKQAPKGMVKPTEKFLKKRLKQIFSRKK